MELNRIENKGNSLFIILLLIHLVVVTVWLVGQNINVYRYVIVGAIFEILWLPMIVTIIFMPIASFYYWYKDKFKRTSKFLYLLLGTILSIVILFSLTST